MYNLVPVGYKRVPYENFKENFKFNKHVQFNSELTAWKFVKIEGWIG